MILLFYIEKFRLTFASTPQFKIFNCKSAWMFLSISKVSGTEILTSELYSKSIFSILRMKFPLLIPILQNFSNRETGISKFVLLSINLSSPLKSKYCFAVKENNI